MGTPSNYHFDLLGVPLDQALAIAFADAPGGTARHWCDEPAHAVAHDAQPSMYGDHPRRLILAWGTQPPCGEPSGSTWHPFPAPATAETAVAFVRDWLLALPRDAAGPTPDIDGDVERSWRVVNPPHSMWSSAFVIIEPAWAEYHK